MGLEEIEKDISADADDKIKKLKTETSQNKKEILSKAQADAEKRLEDARREAEATLEHLRKKKIAAARRRAKQTLLLGKEKVVDKALAKVRAGLEDFVNGKQYEKNLKKCAQKAAEEAGPGCRIYARAKDRSLLKGLNLAKDPLECIGGVIVESEDARIRIDATIDRIFEDKRDRIRQSILKRQFP